MHKRYRFAEGDFPYEALPVASPYDKVGSDYGSYADGDPDKLFAFEGLHAYADKCVWSFLSAKLRSLRATGAKSVRILDAGCGPGTWLRRIIAHAHWLGFEEIWVRGFDVSEVQIVVARKKSRGLARLKGVHLTLEVADLRSPLPGADASVDLSLCLYSVLSHLPREALPGIVAEFARVTRGHFLTTVRAVGSTPTIYVDALEKARSFRQDNARDRCLVELSNGAHMEFGSHLFAARELKACFEGAFHVEELRGLDIFHGRFAPDRRWNPTSMEKDDGIEAELSRLEEKYAHDGHMIDRANHLLLVGRAKS